MDIEVSTPGAEASGGSGPGKLFAHRRRSSIGGDKVDSFSIPLPSTRVRDKGVAWLALCAQLGAG